ncbi:MAG: hypothetical protein V2A69_10740 [Pseudomonadota bacterium]
MKNQGNFTELKTLLCLLLPLLLLAGCATVSAPPTPSAKTEILPPGGKIKEIFKTTPPAALPPLAALKPKVAAEEKMPFERKLFSLSTRSAPLQDVLLGLAKEAGLNLVMEKAVDPMEPVSVEIKDLTLKKALDIILTAYAYFYDIEGNILRIKTLETRLFTFDYPLVSNRPESDIGGDVLGSGGGGGSSSTTNLSGEFSIESDVDEEQVNVWQQIENALKSGEEEGLLSEQGRAQITRMAGTIVVTDRRENILLVEKYLNELKKSLKRQVMIEAKIIEVNLTKGHQYGIDWSYLKDKFGGTPGNFTINTNLSTGTSALNIGWLQAAGGPEQLGVFLDALATQGNVNVLSSPRLNVLNNQTALISVGRAIPYLQWELRTVGTATTTGATIFEPVPTVVRSQAGVTLGVTPQISGDGVTTLHIVPIITDLVEFRSFSFQGSTFEVPVIDIRETDTIVRVPNGTTVVIGGMIQDKTRDNNSRIPLLGDIPLLGKLFSQQIRSSEKVELVILLTPTIVEE